MKENIVRYSKVRHGMSKKEKKIYNKNDNRTIFLDKTTYYYHKNDINFVDLKTLIIDSNFKNCSFFIEDIYADDIYVDTFNNLGGITIPYNYILKNNNSLRILLAREKINKDKEINILVNKDKIVTLDLKNVEKIYFSKSDDESIFIEIKDDKSNIEYYIDRLGNQNKVYISYEIHQNDIKNNILDLNDYMIYDEVTFARLNIDTLIINKNILKNIDKFEGLFKSVKFNKLIILDNNDMKLFQDKYEINLRDKDTVNYYNDSKYGNFIFIEGENKIIFYIDSNDKHNLIDENKLINEEILENNVLLRANMFYTNYVFIMITKFKNGNSKITSFDKEYIIDKLFNKFILLNIDNYFCNKDNVKISILENDWYSVFNKWHITIYEFDKAYEGFLEFKNRLYKLNSMGFTSDAINYLLDRKIYEFIGSIDNDFNLNDLNQEEINLYNKLGENHKKVKSLRNRGDSK